MKKLISVLWVISVLSVSQAWSQAFPPNQAGVTMGHWHLNSRDIEANRKIFVGMGGTSPTGPGIQRVVFPGVVVNLNPGQPSPPPTGGSQGSVVNHVGFVVNNVQEQVAKWKAAGVPVSPGNNGRLDQAFVTTPDGLRIALFYTKLETRLIRPLLAADHPPAAPELRAALRTVDRAIREYVANARLGAAA